MTHDRTQVERIVCLVAMQKDRHAGDGDVGQQQRDADVTPGREFYEAAKFHGWPRVTGLYGSPSGNGKNPGGPGFW